MDRDDKDKKELTPVYREDRITRRQAMKRIAVAGAVVAVPGAFIACNGNSGGSSSTCSWYACISTYSPLR